MKLQFSTIALLASAVTAYPAISPQSPGQLATYLNSETDSIITITGQDSRDLLVELSQEVVSLAVGHGLMQLTGPIGSVVQTASNKAELSELFPTSTESSLSVTGQDGSILLVQLSPPAASSISGLGLESLTNPVGKVVTVVDHQAKRQSVNELLGELNSQADSIVVINGNDNHTLFIELVPGVATLLSKQGLVGQDSPLGSVVASASSIKELISGLEAHDREFITIANKEGQFLLVSLSPAVTSLVSGLDLPEVNTPVGSVVRDVTGQL